MASVEPQRPALLNACGDGSRHCGPTFEGELRMATAAITLRNGARISLVGKFPVVAVHLECIAVFFVGFHWSYLIVCLALFYVRMFFVTAGYHRYFSHRAFKTSRAFQFIIAVMATTSTQKGVLWWAANHRHHHRYSATEADLHSPTLFGFWWSHIGWVLSDRYNQTKSDLILDFYKYPELRWLNKYHLVPPIALAVILFLAGGRGMLEWGFFVSTVMLLHASFTIISLSNLFGPRRTASMSPHKNYPCIASQTMQ